MNLFKKIIFWFFLISLTFFFISAGYYSYHKSSVVSELKAQSKIIETPYGEIEYKISGKDGPIILYVHGTPGGYDRDFPFGGEYKIINISRPGYLRTPLSSGFKPKDQAKLYKALLDSLEIESVFVFGSSGGGPSAIEFAILYPEMTKGLISYEALTKSWVNRPDGAESLSKQSDFQLWCIFKIAELMGIETMVSFLMPNPLNQEKVLANKTQSNKFKDNFWSVWPMSLRKEGYENDFKNYLDLSLSLEKISVPTIAIHGDEDINVNISHSKELSLKVKNSKIHVIKGADHFMHFSHNKEIKEILDTFITENVKSSY